MKNTAPARDAPETVGAAADPTAPQVLRGLVRSASAPFLSIRTPRPWSIPVDPSRATVEVERRPSPLWRRAFDRAQLRIVTGSRTLLEAIALGGPFLYFNGVLGNGASRHRHRPEKLDRMLKVARIPRGVRRDLVDFAGGRRIEEVVRRAARDPPRLTVGFRRDVRRRFAPGWDDAGALIVRIAREFERDGRTSSELVRNIRAASRRGALPGLGTPY